MNLENKVAIVTGAARGIGRGISLVFARNGADVVIADINLKEAESVKNEVITLGRQAQALHLDVNSRPSIEKMTLNAINLFGKVDILVNAAGVVAAPGWEEREKADGNDWDWTFKINLKGTAMVIDVLSEHMKEMRYGKIINISSIAGRRGSVTSIPYSASKAGVISVTQSTAMELAPFSINVNAICPGLLWTPMWERIAVRWSQVIDKWKGLSPREIFELNMKDLTPLGREQCPEDIGNLAAFLASDYSKNITGQTINVDGGMRRAGY